MATMGRPRVLDEGKRREVCALMAAGASRAQAAEYVGCSESTLKREAMRDREFGERMRRAKATASLTPLHAMRQAAQTHWRAAAWMLERAEPEQFGRRHRRHLGAKELRALRRDLIDIFRDEIDHPVLRDRVAKRVKAAIDYAMRHAWDSRRTGGELRSAMEFFDRRGNDGLPAADPWEPLVSLSAMFDRTEDSPRDPQQDSAAGAATDGTFEPAEGKSGSKVADFCTDVDAETSENRASNGRINAQKS